MTSETEIESKNLKPLSGMSLAELEVFVQEQGLPKFRASQIHTWIYAKNVSSFDEMTNLGAPVREKLKQVARIGCLDIAHLQVSRDENAQVSLSTC